MTLCALFGALIALCSWLCVPIGDIAFTMQTFAVFLTLGLLGGKWGTVTILVYLLLGAVGMPVFTAFRGGIGVLAGVTGGYLWGFLFRICIKSHFHQTASYTAHNICPAYAAALRDCRSPRYVPGP